jgi:RNA recognition motif-containing protein
MDHTHIMSMKLYVGNLSFQTSSHDLEELFAGVGTVESASVVEDRETGRSRGFGFVEMASQAEGEKAIAELDGSEHQGRTLKVNEAKPREDRGGFGGGGGGNRGGGGGRNRGGGGGGGYGGGQNRW